MIDQASGSGNPMDLLLVPFPSSDGHFLPHRRENLSSIPNSEFGTFLMATSSLQDAVHQLLKDHRPDCLVSDSLLAWTADVALDLGFPRLIFHGPGIFALCVHNSLELHAPYNNVADDSEPFTVKGLPHRIEMTKSELPDVYKSQYVLDRLRTSEQKSFGIVVNSFYELEPAYAELYRKERKAWYVWPVSMRDRERDDWHSHAERGHWLSWLDSKPESSVMYVCFRSLCEVSGDQLREIALGLEASGHPFLWVVKDPGVPEAEWLPEGFEKRMEGRGVVIRDWAPQMLILGHPSVGGFVTHCGWNSTLEAVSAGVPMAAWPLAYEQFIKEKLITQVLGIGVRVRSGAVRDRTAMVSKEEVARAVMRVMGSGDEVQRMRQRARDYAAMARAAMEEGGSSYCDMRSLIDELKTVLR